MSFRLVAVAGVLMASVLSAGCNGDTGSTAASCEAMKGKTYPLAYDGDAVAFWDTTKGCIAAELYLAKAPITAGNFANLTKDAFFDGTRFHRVIDQFMIQDGDPNSKDTAKAAQWGTGGPGYTIKDEFPCQDGFRVVGSSGSGCDAHDGLLFRHTSEGMLSMANSGPNTGGSQYFITLAPTPHLDDKHAIFGKVVDGIETVRAIGKTPTDARDRPTTDVVVTKLFLSSQQGG